MNSFSSPVLLVDCFFFVLAFVLFILWLLLLLFIILFLIKSEATRSGIKLIYIYFYSKHFFLHTLSLSIIYRENLHDENYQR